MTGGPRTRRCAAALLALFTVSTAPAGAQSLEYEVKAAFLYHFTQFAEWPADAFSSASAPLVVCIVGADPFGRILEQYFSGERHNGRPYSLRRVAPSANLTACHLIFIPRSEQARAAQILSRPMGHAALTVGEFSGFIAAGGIVNFFMEENRVRFEIHQAAADRAGVRISSRLLRLARLTPNGSVELWHEVVP